MDVSDQRTKTKEEAAAWLLRLESGSATRPEREAFVDWLRESPLHVAEMLRLTNVHDALASFGGWNEVDVASASSGSVVVPLADHVPGGTHEAAAAVSRKRPRWPALAAACLVAIAIGGAALWAGLGGTVITTERGERRSVTLTDGSVLQIDPDTELHVRFAKTARDLTLDRGRAVFRVAKDPGRPFSVKAGETTVRAVGTSFGVERSRAGVRVTVSEGKVAVLSGSNPLATTLLGARQSSNKGENQSLPPKTRNQVFLTANQQITVEQAGSAEPVRTVDSDRELAWARGQLVFEKQSVAAVVADFNHYNQLQLRVADAALANRIVSGVFDSSDPESFIAFLQSTANARVTRSEGDAVELASAN